MALESAKSFFTKVKSDEFFYNQLATANTMEQRRRIITNEGFSFTQEEFESAKLELSDWELTMLEDTTSFRSDKRVAGLEMCCCCGVGGIEIKQECKN